MLISLARKFIFIRGPNAAAAAVEAALRPHAEIALTDPLLGAQLSLAEIQTGFPWVFDMVPLREFTVCSVVQNPFDLVAELHAADSASADRPADVGGYYAAMRSAGDWRFRPQSERLRARGGRSFGQDAIVADEARTRFPELCARLGLPASRLPDIEPARSGAKLPADLKAEIRRDFAADFRLIRSLRKAPAEDSPGTGGDLTPDAPRKPISRPVSSARSRALQPGIYLSYGVTKTGSTLAFELIRAVLEQAGVDQSRLPDGIVTPGHKINFFGGVVSDQVPAALAAAAGRGGLVAIKTHGRPDEGAKAAARDGRLIGHVVFRDPRDIVLSLLDAGVRAREMSARAFSEIVTIEDALASLDRQVANMNAWLELPGMMPLLYDRFAFDLPRTVRQLARQVGVDVSAPDVMAAIENRFTQRNKAVPARHVDEMDPADQRRVMDRFGDVYHRFRDMALAAESALDSGLAA
jgi:hypothetical protein